MTKSPKSGAAIAADIARIMTECGGLNEDGTANPDDTVVAYQDGDTAPRLVAKSWVAREHPTATETGEHTEGSRTVPLYIEGSAPEDEIPDDPTIALRTPTGMAIITKSRLRDDFPTASEQGAFTHWTTDEAGQPSQEQLPLYVIKSMTPDDVAAQKSRSQKYSIAIKHATNTIPAAHKERGAVETDFADPVNYKLPCDDAEHTRNALSRWQDEAGVQSDYAPAERAVIETRLATFAKKFGVDAQSLGDKNPAEKKDATETIQPQSAPEPVVTGQNAPATPSEAPEATKAQDVGATPDSAVIAKPSLSLDGEAMKTMFESFLTEKLGVPLATKDAALAIKDAALATPTGEPAITKDYGEDDADSAQEDAMWSTMADAFMSFLDAERGTDAISDASGGPGITKDQHLAFRAQLDAALDAIFEAMLPTEDNPAPPVPAPLVATYAMSKLDSVKISSPDLYQGLVQHALTTKAGRMISGSNLKHLDSAHDHLTAAMGEDAPCTPKMGGSATKSGEPEATSNLTPEETKMWAAAPVSLQPVPGSGTATPLPGLPPVPVPAQPDGATVGFSDGKITAQDAAAHEAIEGLTTKNAELEAQLTQMRERFDGLSDQLAAFAATSPSGDPASEGLTTKSETPQGTNTQGTNTRGTGTQPPQARRALTEMDRLPTIDGKPFELKDPWS